MFIKSSQKEILTFNNTRALATAVYEANGVVAKSAQVIKLIVLVPFAVLTDLADLAKSSAIRMVGLRKVEPLTFKAKLAQVASSAESKFKATVKSAEYLAKESSVVVRVIASSVLLVGATYLYKSYSQTPNKKESLNKREVFRIEKALGSLSLAENRLTIGVILVGFSALSLSNGLLFYNNKKKNQAAIKRRKAARYTNKDSDQERMRRVRYVDIEQKEREELRKEAAIFSFN